MKKNSSYEIEGNLYEFDNVKLKRLIRFLNPTRGAYEQFFRKVVAKNVGISYDTVKGWVKNATNPSSLDDVKTVAEVLGIPYTMLLNCTHYQSDAVETRLQKIRFEEVTNSFCLQYDGFSNVFDMIIGIGFNPKTADCITSNFAERIMDIVCCGGDFDNCTLPELFGYKFIYSDEDLKSLSNEDFEFALNSGYIDDEGNRFFDENGKIILDREQFAEKLINNVPWLNEEERKELREVLEEANSWWDYCEVPFANLKIDINVWKYTRGHFLCGQGWVEPTHTDRWQLILDILALVGTNVFSTGLCNLEEMRVNQFESQVFLTIDMGK